MMGYADIENKSCDELKAERDALIEMAKAEPSEVIAARYIKALTDAKYRDETLAKQAKTLAALQDGLTATKQQAEAAVAKLTEEMQAQGLAATAAKLEAETELARCQATLDATRKELTCQEAFATEQENLYRGESRRADRLKAEATRNFAALSGAAQLVNNALSQHAIENADSGE